MTPKNRLHSTMTVLAISAFLFGNACYAATEATPKSPTTTAIEKTVTVASENTEIAGGVVWVNGVFKAISPDKKERTLQAKSPIYSRDTLVTDKNSTAEIVFTDNTLMTFYKNTTFRIDEYHYNPKSTTKSLGKYFVELIVGGFRTVTGIIAKSNPVDYKVKTPIVTIGVRGTEYAVYFNKKDIYVNYYKGQPFVTNEYGTLELSKNQPYAYAQANRIPIFVPTQPAVFVQPLTITPAKIETKSNLITNTETGKKEEVQVYQMSTEFNKNQPIENDTASGGSCLKTGGSTSGFTIKIR